LVFGELNIDGFDDQVDVVLRGYSGYNTRWALRVLDKVFPAVEGGGGDGDRDPLAVTVFFGANDACLPDRCSAFQHVPLNEYKHNIHSIVSYLKVNSISLSVSLLPHALPHRHVLLGKVAFGVGNRKVTILV